LAGQVLNKQVRIGRPQTFPVLAGATAGPAYATAVGLLISGATSPAETNDPLPPQTEEKSPRRGIVRWFSESLFG